jgi:hypothetical protein
MPILPSTAPIQYEYKPLNLMAFAAPLSEMQKQLDLTKDVIDSTEFDISHLPYGTDPEKAKELKQLVENKRNEIATNLISSKNYQQAARQIKSLNNLWQKDPHKLALESNAKLFAARDAEELKRLADNKISKSDYEQWKRDEIRKYEELGGASFFADAAKPEGKYNIVTEKIGRLENLEDELQDLSWKVAGAVGTNKREGALREIGIDPEIMDKRFQKTIIEERDPKVVAKAVHDYLLTQPKYTEWGKESAYYNLRDMMASPNAKQYAERIMQGAIRDNATKLKLREEQLKQAKGNKDEDPIYQQLLENQQEYTQMQQTGEYDFNTLKSAYQEQHLNNLFDMSALGKVYAKKDISYEDVFRDIPSSGAGGAGGGAQELGLAPIVTPLTEETFSIPSLNQQKTEAAGNLYKSIRNMRMIGNGSMGSLLLGVTEQDKSKIAKNPAKAFDNGNIVMVAYQKAASAQGNKFEVFKNALRARGLKFDGEKAYTVFQELNKPNSTALANLSAALQAGEQSYADYTTANDNLQAIEKNIKGDFSKELETIGDKSYRFRDNTAITPNNLATQLGYIDLQDAINNGVDFNNLKAWSYKTKKLLPPGAEAVGKLIGNDIYAKKNEIIQKRGTKAEMSYGFINDKETGGVLGQMFRSATDLESYVPAYQGTWKGVPGFTEDGKIAPGTSIEIDKRVPPIVVQHGNKMFYNVAVNYKDEDGKTMSKTLTLTPKAGSQYLNEAFLNHMDEITSNEPGVNAQTKDHIKILKFNTKIGGNLSPQTFNNTEISKGQDAILQSIVYGNNGETIDIVKEQNVKYGDQKPVMRVYISNANGDREAQPLNNPATGKPFYSDDPNAIKAFLARQMKL